MATTDLFSLRSGKKGVDSRRQAVNRKGRDCRKPGQAIQPQGPGTMTKYGGILGFAVGAGGRGQGGSGTKWPQTLIEL